MIKNILNLVKKIAFERIALCLVLAGILLCGAIVFFMTPKKSFSENENRVLASFPSISSEALLSGRFAKGIEAYVGDHFEARDSFVSLNTALQTAIGKRDIGGNYDEKPADGGVYLGKNGHLFEVLLEPQDHTFDKNATAIFDFAKRNGLPFTMLPIPSSAQEMPELLPADAPEFDQTQLLKELEKQAPTGCKVLNVFDTLRYKGTPDTDYYYKTDHHWNIYGAYRGYTVLAESMGLRPDPLSDYKLQKVSDSFYGTLYSKALPAGQVHDSILLPTSKVQQEITQQTGNSVHKGLFWIENLKQKDQYTVFLGGNHGLDLIRCQSAPKGNLLVIKDSFADSLLPFLAPHYSEIHVIDLRYFRGDIDEYIRKNKINRIAAIYSLKQLAEVDISASLTN